MAMFLKGVGKPKGFTLTEVLFVTLIITIFMVILTPFISKIRSQAKIFSCEESLQEIGIGLKLYAAEHDGEFPSSLDELPEGGYIDDRKPLEEGYHYTTGYNILSPSDSVVIFDKETKHKHGKHVLYVSGDIVWQKN